VNKTEQTENENDGIVVLKYLFLNHADLLSPNDLPGLFGFFIAAKMPLNEQTATRSSR
jgi:hypothetical protein